MGKKSKPAKTSHHPYGEEDDEINEHTMNNIKDTIKYYEDNKILDRPNNKIVYPDYIFEMKETNELRKLYNGFYISVDHDSQDYPDISWSSLKKIMGNEHQLFDDHFINCLWLYVKGCPRNITTNILFKYDVCVTILDATRKNFGKYNTAKVTDALINKGYTKRLANEITDCTHYEDFIRSLSYIIELTIYDI